MYVENVGNFLMMGIALADIWLKDIHIQDLSNKEVYQKVSHPKENYILKSWKVFPKVKIFWQKNKLKDKMLS